MKLRTIAAACAALAFGSSAWAAASASATLSGLTVTLYDLNPTDGIGPSITFQSNSTYGSYVSTSASDFSIGSQSGAGWSFSPLGPAGSSSAKGGAQAGAAVSGSLGSGVTMSASGSAAGWTVAPPDFFSNVTSFGADAYAGAQFGSLRFELSPFTLAVINGQASLTATTTVGAKEGDDFSLDTESASAGFSMGMSGPGPSGGGDSYQSSSDNVNLYADWGYFYDPETGTQGYTGESVSLDRAFALSFTNLSGGALGGDLSIRLSVSGYSNVAAVPEPGSIALMVAGLGVVGLRLRRRG